MRHPHTEALHRTERFRRRDAGHLEIEVTIDDPKAYTRPITYPCELLMLRRWTHDFQFPTVIGETRHAAFAVGNKQALVDVPTDVMQNDSLFRRA